MKTGSITAARSGTFSLGGDIAVHRLGLAAEGGGGNG